MITQHKTRRQIREEQQQRKKRNIFSLILLFISDIFLTCAIFTLLFVVYELNFTTPTDNSIENSKKNNDENNHADDALFSDPNTIGYIWIPKLHTLNHPDNFKIYKGTDVPILNKGYVGHYKGSAIPGEIGNIVLAAHRNTHGEPFRFINKLSKNDKVIIRTKNKYYIYQLDFLVPKTDPTDLTPLQHIPNPYKGHKNQYITLITCTPEFTSTYRMIWYGHIIKDIQAKDSAYDDNEEKLNKL